LYNADALEKGIEACRKNIKTFEEAIEKEYATIKEYRRMKEVIERKQMQANENRIVVNLEESKDDDKK